METKIQGQLSDAEFKAYYPHAKINYSKGLATIRYGKYTTNYWVQHSDGSWTNYDCKTNY